MKSEPVGSDSELVDSLLALSELGFPVRIPGASRATNSKLQTINVLRELCRRRMLAEELADRDFTELDLRGMLQSGTRVRRSLEPSRWIVSARLRRRRWDVIVEPDAQLERLVIITAYPLTP